VDISTCRDTKHDASVSSSGKSPLFRPRVSQQVTQGWNGVFSQSGSQVMITNASYNSTIPANGSVNPGFNGSWNGTNSPPTAFTLNGAACTVV
jgi:Cellulose binding domain